MSHKDRYSIPAWLWQKIEAHYGLDNASELAQVLLTKAPFALRVNEVRTSRKRVLAELTSEGIEALATPFSPLGIRVSENFCFQTHSLFLEGPLEV